MSLELSDLTLEEALRSYSSVKGHRTRVEKEIGNLLRLLTNNYSVTSEERLNDKTRENGKTYTQTFRHCRIPYVRSAKALMNVAYAKEVR